MNIAVIPLLIVDDDPVFVAYAQGLLAALGGDLPCAVHRVDSAPAALAELRQHQYEIMLLDYNLPGVKGLDLLLQIQQLPADHQPAVIMLTGSGNEAIAVEAMKRGAKDYLVKLDLDLPPLRRAITSALAQKHLEDQLASANARMQEDLRLAHELQLALLPQTFPSIPPGAPPEQSVLRFSYKYLSSTELAGDFFDVFAVPPASAGVIICDVMGHGVRASLVTAMLRVLVEKFAPVAAAPEKFLHEINHGLQTLLAPMGTPIFATAFYVVADVARGRMRFASAGHPSALLLRRDAGRVEPLSFGDARSGPALGLFDDAAFPVAECALAANDLVVLYTDGLYEVTSPDGEEYGRDRLLAAFGKHIALPPAQMFDELLGEITRFSGSKVFEDDVCIIGMEVTRTENV